MAATAIIVTGDNSFETIARGVAYRLRLDPLGRWEVTSNRLALQPARMGGSVRHFDSLTAVSNTIAAFRGIDQLID